MPTDSDNSAPQADSSPSAGSVALLDVVQTCGMWLLKIKQQIGCGKTALALGCIKCLQVELEELAFMLGQPRPTILDAMAHHRVEDMAQVYAATGPRPATVRELAKELDAGQMPPESRRELFVCMMAARDLVDYLRSNTGDNADWPIEIKTDDETVAAGLVAKLESLERLLPPNAAGELQPPLNNQK